MPAIQATTGITAILSTVATSISPLWPAFPGQGDSRSAAPYDISIAGIASPDSSRIGESTTRGSSHPVTASTTPITDATVSGLVISRRIVDHAPTPRPVRRSSTISAIGCTTIICTSRVGTTTVVSPTTKAATAMPRLPALT